MFEGKGGIKMYVGDVMHACTILSADMSVSEAAKIMEEHLTSSILVREDGVVKGVVTERDILRKIVAKSRNPDHTRLSEIMNTPLIKIDENATLYEASELMDSHNIRRLVVTSSDNRIIGVVNTTIVSRNLRYITAREKIFIRPEYTLTEWGY